MIASSARVVLSTSLAVGGLLVLAGCDASTSTGPATAVDAGTSQSDAQERDGAGAGTSGDAASPVEAGIADAGLDALSAIDGGVADGNIDAGSAPGGDAGSGGVSDGSVSPRQRLLGFLSGISGHSTLSGEHDREASQGDFIQAMHDVSGHYPALWGGDFLYEQDAIQNRSSVIQHLMQGWRGGAVVSLMYHACPPTQGESCAWNGGVLSSLSDPQWTDLTTDGGTLNQVWKSRLDAIAQYFQMLKDAGMAATFRPHHEMNQGVFWWAGRPGANGTAQLYRITHDYLVNTKGLDNIVWVWSVQDIWNSQDNGWDFDLYNPGDSYWDVMSLDFYDGKGYTTDKYNAMLAVAGTKPIAIGECQVLPTEAELRAQPRWVYFMGWAELVQQNNSNAAITALYTASNVLTQDKMPGW